MENQEARRIQFVVEESGERLDQAAFARLEGHSRAEAQRFIRSGLAAVDGLTEARPAYRLKKGQKVTLDLPEVRPFEIRPESIPLNIVFEDDCLIVVNKQKGMPVHPSPSRRDGTLVNALMGLDRPLSVTDDATRPGIVHRLDKDTSGLLVVAKTPRAHLALARQIQERTAKRIYLAVAHGRMPGASGSFTENIGRSTRDRKKMAALDRGGKTALTHWRVLQNYAAPFCLVEARLETGRTHQIRVHFSNRHRPVAGDVEYGGLRVRDPSLSPEDRRKVQEEVDLLQGQALHARQLSFRHPVTGADLDFSAPPPDDMTRFMRFLESFQPGDGQAAP